MSTAYRSLYTFGEDYGTIDFKYGPITLGDFPEIVENRGYFPDKSSIIYKIMGTEKDVIVGKELPLYLETREGLPERLIYPMRNGVISKSDIKAWRVVEELTRYALRKFKPPKKEFQGFYTVASISSVSPRYMYENIFKIHEKLAKEGLVKAATIIPQPLAVAIAHKITTCVVLESGHGNTQVCPISHYPVRNAIVAINRGGSDANMLTAEILKDCGYGDLAHEETLVRRVKENIGLVPADLDKAIKRAKENKEKFRAKYKIPGTRIEIDLADNSWTRFLIGEYVFNPTHEIFQSYFKRGMPKPKDVKIGDVFFMGMLDFGEAVVTAVEKCPIELQPFLYKKILLSGGNFAWDCPSKLAGVAVDSATKMKLLLKSRGIDYADVIVTESPQYSVWRGCIVYGYAVPEDYRWSWDRMEGWMFFE